MVETIFYFSLMAFIIFFIFGLFCLTPFLLSFFFATPVVCLSSRRTLSVTYGTSWLTRLFSETDIPHLHTIISSDQPDRLRIAFACQIFAHTTFVYAKRPILALFLHTPWATLCIFAPFTLCTHPPCETASTPVLDTLQSLVWCQGTDGTIVYKNKTLTAWEQKHVQHAPLLSDAERHKASHQAAQGGTHTLHIRKTLADITLHWEISVFAHNKRVWFVARDVSERAQHLKLINNHESHVERLLLHLPLGAAIFNKDQALTRFNPRFTALFQLDEGWLRTSPSLEDILHQMRKQRALPEVIDFKAYYTQFQAFFHMATKKQQEDVWHLPDERSVRTLTTSLPTGGCAILFENITEMLHLKRQTNDTLALLKSVSHTITDGILVLDAALHVTLVNPRFLNLLGIRAMPSVFTGTSIEEHFSAAQKSFAHPGHFRLYKTRLMICLAQHVPQSTTILRSGQHRLSFEYTPLPNGQHIIRLGDTHPALSQSDLLGEAQRMVRVEKALALNAMRGLNNQIRHHAITLDAHSRSGQTAQQTWLPTAMVSGLLRDHINYFEPSYSVVRDSTAFGEVLDQTLATFAQLMTERQLTFKLKGSYIVRLTVNRKGFTQFIERLLGSVIYSAQPGTHIVCDTTKLNSGMILLIFKLGTQHTPARQLGEERPFFSIRMLKQLASPASCTLDLTVKAHNVHKLSCRLLERCVEQVLYTVPKKTSVTPPLRQA